MIGPRGQLAAQRLPARDGWIPTSWSPNGLWLAVWNVEGKIGQMNVASGQIEELSDRGYYATWLDDQRILVALYDTLRVIDVNTRVETEIGKLPGPIPLTPSVSVGAGGKVLVVSTMQRDTDIWVGSIH